MRPIITKIDLNNKVYGGRVYENQVVDLLGDSFVFKRVFLMKYRCKVLNIPRILFLLFKYRLFYRGTLLLTNQTTWFVGRCARNIAVIHHLDSKFSCNASSFYQTFCERALFRNRKKFDAIITVAKCWKQQLEYSGFENVSVIYNSFDTSLYQFPNAEIEAFKAKYEFTGKPLIYLGNCQKKKGVVEAYNSLKGIDALFVTTGNKDVELPIPNLMLSFKEYRLLLAAADVVITMSLFNEGWNRVAHEAILSGTPVIGSGKGGMGELLTMTGQIICQNFEELPHHVINILQNKSKVKDSVIEKFNLVYFKECWRTVLTQCCK